MRSVTPARAKLSDTRQGDARDCTRLQGLAVLPYGRRRDSTDRPSQPIVHPRTATAQPTTYSVVRFYGIQLSLYLHLQNRGIEHC
ncbi:hypothetical protein CLOM_g147 [Closterium sp. NIES-68]|nr:hypothetical protein CLOM_g147 [Closterium sp. NIES-68]